MCETNDVMGFCRKRVNGCWFGREFLRFLCFTGSIGMVMAVCGLNVAHAKDDLRVATFNVSMEADNYKADHQDSIEPGVLTRLLAEGKHPQIQHIAEIIQRVRPDVLLLNEFDYIENSKAGIEAFNKNFLAVAQHSDVEPIAYPYFYIGPVNPGEPSPFDFNRDGVASGKGEDAWGYGQYPGQYGMAVLSRYPIDNGAVRSFRHFNWADMPAARVPVHPESGENWYTDAQWQAFRLPSKALWDVPITVAGKRLHLLASHPTPPVFDGPENRNGLRNHDEIRLIADYLNGADYLYDDQKNKTPFAGQRFVIVGDLNASVNSKETVPGTMEQLLEHPKVNASFTPTSGGAKANAPDIADSASHTAAWRSRADYVLPSQQGWKVLGGGVFWPEPGEPLHRLVASRKASSDHRLVYVDLQFQSVDD